MNNLVFLLGAIGLSVLGSVLLWLRYRKPTGFMSSIGEFQREMDALGRDHQPSPRRGTKGPSQGSPPDDRGARRSDPSAPPGQS